MGAVLSQVEKLGSIRKCCSGLIHVTLPGITVHITKESFVDFAHMVKEANEVLMSEWLNEL